MDSSFLQIPCMTERGSAKRLQFIYFFTWFEKPYINVKEHNNKTNNYEI